MKRSILQCRKCSECSCNLIDFERHLQKLHGVTLLEYCNEYPGIVTSVVYGIVARRELRGVICQLCGVKRLSLHEHLKSPFHKTTVREYRMRFPDAPVLSRSSHERVKTRFRGITARKYREQSLDTLLPNLDPYSSSFTFELKEWIRARDDLCCQLCGVTQAESGRRLCIHHIDYDKRNSDLANLIALCPGCHTMTNGNRAKWTRRLRARMTA